MQVNCGHARVAILELSGVYRGRRRSTLNRKDLTQKFLELFSSVGFQDKPSEYWYNENRCSTFDKHVDYILNCFSAHWKSPEVHREYVSSFSVGRWSTLSSEQQSQHTMSHCITCAREHLQLQKTFPTSPYYVPPPIVDLTIPPDLAEPELTRTVLRELNQSYQSNYQHKFVDSAIKVCGSSEGIERKKTSAEKKKDKRKWQRNFRDSVNKQFSKNAGLSFLAENESFSGYQRKRLSQSFELKQPGRIRSHVPSDEILSRYSDAVLERVSLWPADKTINWSELARQCNIEGSNKGQIAKVIAEKNGIPMARLNSNRKKSNRTSKAKLPGNEVSIPSMPTNSAIKADISILIETGELTLGEPCTPFPIVKSKVVDGVVEKKTSLVYGRKIPLIEVRKKLIQRQEKFMRLLSDDEINSLSFDDLRSYIGMANKDSNDLDGLRSELKSLQRTRHLALWHDHSTILGAGYVLMTIHVLYDPAVFLNYDEYTRKSGDSIQINIQQCIEEPEIYILCLSGSSPTDQVATIADRLDCLSSLSTPIKSSSGVDICDKLLYFVGDHPAQAFERGSQMGGNYKCGNCGSLANRMAHVFRSSWRTLEDLQNLVLQGKFGCRSGVLKPFDKLKKAELQEELSKRGVSIVDLDKTDLLSALSSILKGAQRVPTILLTNPSQCLADLNLARYSVLDSEPLHDLKGHLINLLSELLVAQQGIFVSIF